MFSNYKIVLASSFLVSACFFCSAGFADEREFFTDTINLTSGGIISDLQVEGDLSATIKSNTVLKLSEKLADDGCSSGEVFTKMYNWDYQNVSVSFCADVATVSFSYTSDAGKVCHVTLTDGAYRVEPSIQSVDCSYTFEKTSYFNKFKLDFQG